MKTQINIIEHKNNTNILIVLFAFLPILVMGQFDTTRVFTSSGSWTCPLGVSTVLVECIGAGGAGGSGRTNNDRGGGGGAGGQYAVSDIGVSFNQNFSVIVAGQTSGPTANNTNGSQGADSEFALGATVLVRAKGGAGGVKADGTRAGGVGSDAGGIGDEVYEGGSGGNGTATASGGGGGGAGSGGVGGSASGTEAGTGTSVGGGNGGGGRSVNSNGNPGINFGGGGAGARRSSSGGNGAQGFVSLSFTCPERAQAGSDQTLGECATAATLAATAASYGTGTWTVVSGSATIDNASSPTSSITLSAGSAVTLRWTITNGACTSYDDVTITSTMGEACITRTWNGAGVVGGTGSTDFNNSANWSPSGSLDANTSVVINTDGSTNTTLTLSANTTVKNMTINHTPSAAVYLAFHTSTYQLNIMGDFESTANGSSSSYLVDFMVSNSGKIVFNGNASFSTTGSAINYINSTFQTSSTGTIQYNGNITFSGNSGCAASYLPQTITFDGTGTQTITNNTTSNDFLGKSIIIGSTNNPTVVYTGSSSGRFIIITSDVTINGTSTLDLTTKTFNRSASGGTFTLADNATLRLGHNSGGIGSSNFPANFTTYTLSSTSTVEYYRAGTQTVFGTTYGNLTISGSDTKTLGANTTVAGNWVNNGTFAHGSRTVTFSGAANKTISGSSSTTFHNITVNKGSDTTYHIEATGPMSMAGHLTLTNGVFKLTHASSSAQFTSNPSTLSTAGLWVNGGSLTTGNHEVDFFGLFRVEDGTVSIGTASNNELEIYNSNALLDIRGGILNVAGLLRVHYGAPTFNMSGGTLNICTVGNSLTNPSFLIETTAKANITGGDIVLQNRSTGSGRDFRINSGTGTKTITGGTLQIGNASTPASSTFLINSGIPIHNLVVNSTNSPVARLRDNHLSVNNNVTILGGTLDAATYNLNLTVGGNWTNNGAFSCGIATVTFNGTENKTIGGSSVTTFYNLTNTNTATKITLNQNISVTNTLNMAGNADIDLNGNNISLGTTGSLTGESNDDRIYDAIGTTGVSGMITATRNLNAPSAVNVAGLGAVLTSSANLGSTEIKRGHLTHEVLNDNIGIKRYYSITPTTNTGLNATFAFNYFENELNGNAESNLTLWRSTDVTNPDGWTNRDGTVDAGAKTVTLTGIDAFSVWTAADADNSPLPISLLTFTAQPIDNKVLLNWTTASEQNNDYFTIEKTRDGINFEQVGTVKGGGNTTSTLHYSNYDYDPYPGLSYYRLKQTDYNGISEVFNLVTVEFLPAVSLLNFAIYPNPTNGSTKIFIYHQGTTDETAQLILTDVAGKLITQQTITLLNGGVEVNLDLTNYESGIYYVTFLSSTNERINQRLIKQ